MNEKQAKMVLNAIPGLGNARIRQLIEHFGCAKDILRLTLKRLTSPRIVTEKVAQNIISFNQDSFLDKEQSLMKDAGVALVTYQDRQYPDQLKEIPDAPVVLYVKGDWGDDNHISVGIVGSRRASVYGITVAEKFSLSLAELGITIVSGMAKGIDAAAHRGALKAQGKTIAVLGSGLSQVYPSENKKLFQDIARTGAVVSEFPMETLPLAFNFPRRNRIVSGLSLGIVVVEAAARSGALITSGFALEQGREVFAVPGKVGSATAVGTNRLIKQGAKLVSCVEDILEELKPALTEHVMSSQRQTASLRAFSVDLSDDEKRALRHFTGEPVHIDEFSRCLQDQFKNVTPLLLKLEMRGLIKQLPGKYFIACGEYKRIS